MSAFDRFSRRRVLKSTGVLLGLPILESFAQKASFEVKPRAIFIFLPNGVWCPDWKVNETAKDYVFPRSLESLKNHKKDILMLGNLGHEKARANGDGAGDHARSSGTFLTARQIYKTSGKNIQAGVSFDQVLASKVRGQCDFDSLEYSMEAGGVAGQCDSGYSCAYVNNISWANAHLPLARESRVRDAFERLFGDPEAHVSQRNKAILQARQSSVLDLVRSESKDLMRVISKNDRVKIEEYQDSLRDLEKSLNVASHTELDQDIELPDFSRNQRLDYPRKVKLFYDVMTLALQTNKTRVMSLMLGRGGSNLRHKSLGMEEGHHALSHHQNKSHKIEQLKKIDRYHAEHFAYFLDRLKSVQEGERNLLDNSMVLFGSCIRDGNRHDHHDLPLILAGSSAGGLKSGGSKVFAQETPLSNLFLTISDQFGAPVQKFGDSTGRVDLVI
ncbi:DUF1552 domain-containing protein [Lentisphaera marina]|uniref:DUF1552 domain-containing protein n=1 Tax=Lentisphaera marina TaxID=1111041 RepID=UPI002366EA6B|nr:DUF1552 domain-containing protein [Lentisphaera marina]MDD7984331.1 DUF1552 domain-containing protein [Lentisphaera marina]